jgi:1-acyl-sn-glycerol-3-phosphate acyltransferase
MNVIRSVWVWIASVTFILLAFPVSLLLWLISLLFDHKRLMNNSWMIFQGNVLIYMNPIWKVSVKGRKKINRKQEYVIVSNHQSILDIVVFNKVRHRLRWVSKIEVFKVPVLGWSMRMTKYIGLERGNKHSVAKMMDQCVESLNEGVSVVIFPEGTRSLNGSIGKFKTGAFQLAIKTNRPILPVVLDGTGDILPKKGYIFRDRQNVRIRVLDPIFPNDFGTDSPEELAEKIQVIMSESLEDLRKSS